MSLFDLAGPSPIDTAPFPRTKDGALPYLTQRKPVIFESVRENLPFTQPWNYQFFKDRLKTIRIQRPSSDGIYHYLGFSRIGMEEFDQLLTGADSKKDAYALEPLKGRGVAQALPGDLGLDLPAFIDESCFRVSNLYVGPGNNASLLHFDEVHSLLMMLEGRKRFILFPPDQSPMMYPYGMFNLRSIIQNRVVDSRINCASLDFEQFPKLRRAQGIAGWLEEGQALLIPAGTWHFIEAEGINVSVNYFWMQNRLQDWLKRPLRDFWVKRRAISVLNMARQLKHTISPT